MKGSVRDLGNEYLAIVLGCVLVAGCTSSSYADAWASDSGRASMDCPSQDFTTFLQRFADPSDARVRQEFTADPLEYEVPTHRVENETASSPPTHVSQQAGPARLQLFRYRYFKRAGGFDRIEPGETVSEAEKHVLYPVVTTAMANGGRKVVFGAEYEVDTFHFKRSNKCWYLTRAIDLRD